MRKISLIILLLFGFNIVFADVHYKILPKPKKVDFIGDGWAITHEPSVFIDGTGMKANYCKEEIKKIGSESGINFKISEDKNSDVKLLLVKKLPFDSRTTLSNEGYLLRVGKKGVVIKAKTYRGLFYGLQTFRQILKQSGKTKIAGVKIEDYPDLKFRGISDDLSRGQVSKLKNFFKIIDFISEYKMNVYMPYIEDVLKFDSFPTIGKNRGALTKKEVAAIVNYAKKKFVDVIPIFQTLGHYENILSQKEFLKYAEFPGSATLDVSDDSVYVFLDKLLKEVTELFPSEYFHMGADESFDVGLGKSKRLVDSIGIAAVHARHYKKVYSLLRKYGKKVMMYGDIILRHPEIMDLIPKDIIIVDWHYRPYSEYPSVKKFHKAGFKTIVSPSVWNFLTTYPTNVNALPNIKQFTKAGVENNSLGMINSNWGDFGAETFKELLYWDYAFSAACSWNCKGTDITEFNSEFFKSFFGTNSDVALELNLWFSNPLNQFLWNEIWRHPLLSLKKSVWWSPNVDPTAKILWLKETLPLIKAKTSVLEQEAKENRGVIDIYKFLNNLYSWYALKMETTLTLLDTNITVERKKEIVIPMINSNIDSLSNLENEFCAIWTRYYKPANLNLIKDKFERLISYFKETGEELKNDTLFSPLIPSKWIYCKVNEDSLAKKADFYFSFNVGKKIKSAKLQMLGNTFAELYLNGKFVADVFARRTLSLPVEYKRVKYLDVKKYLKNGENEILVHVINYNRKGGAGVNVIGEIVFEDGSKFELMSDGNWKSKPFDELEFGESTVEKESRYEIIAPNFKTDRPSWIER